MKKKILMSLIISIFVVFLLISKIDVSSLVLKPAINELQDMLGMEVSIEKAYLHFIPLSLEFKNVVVFNSEKEKLTLKKAKFYVGLTKIFSKEIEIRRVVLYSTDFSMKYSNLNKCIESVSNYLKKPTKFPIKLRFNSFEIENLSGSIYTSDLNLNFRESYGRVILKTEPQISVLSSIKLLSSKYPNIDTNMKVFLRIKDNEIILEELKLFNINSLLKSSGKINYINFLGEFIVSGKILFKSIMKIFGMDDGYGEINVDGKVTFDEGRKWQDKIKLNLKFNGGFLLEQLMQILKVSEKLSGVTEIKGEAQGSLSNPQVNAKVSLKKGNILGVKVDEVESHAVYKNGILDFKNGKVKLYGGYAQAHVWITLPKVVTHYAYIELNDVSSNGVFELIHWNPGIAEGIVKGWLVSEGEKFSPKGSFVYLRKGHKPDDLRGKIEWINGNFDSLDKVYRFSLIEVGLSKSQVKAYGYIDTKNSNLNFNFTGRSKDISELLIPYQKGIYGELDFNGKLYGNTEDPEISISFFSKRVNIFIQEIEKSLPEQAFAFNNLKGNIFYKKNLLSINELNGEDISLKGKILFPFSKKLFDIQEPSYDLLFSVKNLSLKNLHIKALDNDIETFLNLQGTIKDKGKITAKINGNSLFLGKNKFIDKFAGLVSLEKDTIVIKSLNIFNDRDLLNASGYLNFNGDVNISGISKTFDITNITQHCMKRFGIKYLEKVKLNNLNFSITGSIKNPAVNAYTNFIAKVKNGRNIDGLIKFNYKQNDLIVELNLMKNIFFTIRGLPDKKHWNISGNFASARIDPFVSAFVNNLPEDLVILVNGNLKGSINDKNFDAQIDFNRVFMRLYGIGLNNKNPVNIKVEKGNVYFTPITLLGQSTELTIKGKIVDYFDILIEGSSDLRPFKALFKVDDLRGRALMQVYIYESRKNPEIVGGVDINNASITLRKDLPSLSNVNATVSFNEDRIVIEKAYGTFSEGTVQLDGTIYLEKFVVKQLGLSGRFSGVRWIFAPRCWAYMDGQIYLTGAYSQPLLSGQINIQRGVYTEKFEWTRLALKSSPPKITVEKNSWLNNLRFNLRVQTSNFFVNNNLATVNLNSDLLLKGSIPEPSLIGWINAKDGWIYFRGSKFEIMQALIQFNDPNSIRPYLNVSARTNVSQYNINLNLNGYIDQFNLILSSNPPLSESELFNLLVLGQNGGSKGIPGGSEAASFITGQMYELLEERVRGLTGLDVMTVEPGISKTTGSIAPRVTVGKKLMDGRLTVTYSTTTGTTAEQIIKVEYLVKKGISLVGIKDEIGGLSGAVKFRFEFR